jgi:hypothetical protein
MSLVGTISSEKRKKLYVIDLARDLLLAEVRQRGLSRRDNNDQVGETVVRTAFEYAVSFVEQIDKFKEDGEEYV